MVVMSFCKKIRLQPPVHEGLNDWLRNHKENPYPSKDEKDGLAERLGVTPLQVNRWFIQRRKMLRSRGELSPVHHLLPVNTQHQITEIPATLSPLHPHYISNEVTVTPINNVPLRNGFYGQDCNLDSPLLEKILTGRNSPACNSAATLTLIQDTDDSIRNHNLPLTPPQSDAGDFNAVSPPMQGAPLDLCLYKEPIKAVKKQLDLSYVPCSYGAAKIIPKSVVYTSTINASSSSTTCDSVTISLTHKKRASPSAFSPVVSKSARMSSPTTTMYNKHNMDELIAVNALISMAECGY